MKSYNEIRFDVRKASHGWLTVHCTSELLPEEWVDTVGPEILEQILLLRARLSAHKITEAELVRLSLLLGDALVPKSLHAPLAHLISSTPSNQVLRLRIVTHDLDLAAVPWEYVRLRSTLDPMGGPALALDERVSLLRSPASTPPVAAPVLRGATDLRVLHASATEVEGFESLRGDEDAIDLALWGGSGRRTRRVVVDRLSDPATRESLEESLGAGPDLLVFTGHSSMHQDRPALILADEHGRPDPVTGGELASMLLRAGTPLVVLNACDTASADDASVSLAELLVRSGIETVVGMQMPISDSNAGQFAVGMIGSLGEGASIDVAVSNGRRRVAERAGYAEWGVPTLMTSSRHGEPPHEELQAGRLGHAAPRPADELVGATRGGAMPTTTGPRPWAWAIGVVAVLALVVGGTAWAMGRDDTDEVAAVRGTTETADTPAQPDGPVEIDPGDENADGDDVYEIAGRTVEFDQGVIEAELVTGTSVTDTSAELTELLDLIETSGVSPALTGGPGTLRLDLGLEWSGWPGTPVRGIVGSENPERNPDCERLLVSNITVTGVAGRAWASDGHYVAVNAQQLIDAPTARRIYWTTALFTGLRPNKCAGWPASGVAIDPRDLEITRHDFDLDGPAKDILTATGVEFTDDPAIKEALSVVFRIDDRVVVASAGTLDSDKFDAAMAKQVLNEVIRIVAEH